MNEARELPKEEQVKMMVEEAGKKYSNCAIIFTNAEDTNSDSASDYGIPRIVGGSMPECARHPSMKKYRNNELYGLIYYCSEFMNMENIPSVLLPKG